MGRNTGWGLLAGVGWTLGLLFLALLAAVPRVAADSAGEVGRIEPLPPAMRAEMEGVSWRPGCPVSPEDLALVTVAYLDFEGATRTGELVVNARVASEVLDIFKELYARRCPVEKIRRIEAYGGSDDASMADDNTSAFNCRPVPDSNRISNHAYGLAVDINPLRNPYVKNGRILPPGGAAHLDRSRPEAGVLLPGDPCVRAFTDRGWTWGGDWVKYKDYQHFERKLP